MQLPGEMNEGAAAVSPAPASPSSPGSDPGSKTPTAREKPVKVLPCPRCESMNTKFCYYNNYSVTQPRHFCRQCQRYWTAGGTLRNVPVGGGSRKKNRHPPYSQRSPGASSNAFPNVGFPQQQQDMVAALNLPGFALQGHQYVTPYGLDQLSQLSPGVYASILNKQESEATPSSSGLHPGMYASGSAGPSSIMPGGYFTPGGAPPSFPTDHSVKPEYWPVSSMGAPANYPASSSMLLNLGLNNERARPPAWDPSSSSDGKTNVAASSTVKNGSSPHHGSSIEEEGSTPSNGFSKSGYEEGDAVSSMWHSLHDMDNLHLSVKW